MKSELSWLWLAKDARSVHRKRFSPCRALVLHTASWVWALAGDGIGLKGAITRVGSGYHCDRWLVFGGVEPMIGGDQNILYLATMVARTIVRIPVLWYTEIR